ncbi:hypothetical protein [Acinetobacter sp.]|uniref:hypothetical protein n=1 Tax=Acinetobacter sp. TaxID=472 RepID=UPI00388DB51B
MNAELNEVLTENARLEHFLLQLQQQMSLDEWCAVLRRDIVAQQLRRQNELQALIRHATQIIEARKL